MFQKYSSFIQGNVAQKGSYTNGFKFLTRPLHHLCSDWNLTGHTSVAPLAWVPWVPGNPSILEQWVPEPINFGKKQPKCTQISQEIEQVIGTWNLQ